MAQFQAGRVTEVKPQSDVYTVMMVISIVALIVSLAFVIHTLTGSPEAGGYGLTFADIFKPFEK